MKIGYIRVSRDKQTTALQEDAIHQEGVPTFLPPVFPAKDSSR